MTHPLLDLAVRTDACSAPPVPRDAAYDQLRGAWVDSKTGFLLVDERCRKPKPQTKNADVETGEDQKGF